MNTVTVHRATDVNGQPTIEPCTIIIGEPISEALTSPTSGERLPLNTVAHVINYEADAIADTLFNHLPQAVAARVMVRLMERYATNYLGGPRR